TFFHIRPSNRCTLRSAYRANRGSCMTMQIVARSRWRSSKRSITASPFLESFAAAGRSGNRDVFALLDLQVNAGKRVGLDLVCVEDLGDAFEFDQSVVSCHGSVVSSQLSVVSCRLPVIRCPLSFAF